MLQRLNDRLRKDEGGFTLIELLVVIIIIGILLAIAVPSYLGFKERASDNAAKSNVRAATPAVEAYFSENNGAAGDADNAAGTDGYEGMTIGELDDIDAQISATTLTVGTVTGSTYCISSTVGGQTWRKNGPAAAIDEAACP